MLNVKNWYVVYTRPKCERKVAGFFQEHGLESYCPLVKQKRNWSDRKKMLEAPLFHSYVFVYTSSNDHAFIRQAPGVVNLVHWLNKPAIVREDEIAAIRNFIRDYKNITLEKTVVNIHEMVRVIGGPFMNKEGNLVEIKHKTVKVYLPSLGYNLVVEVEKSNIQLLTEKYHTMVS